MIKDAIEDGKTRTHTCPRLPAASRSRVSMLTRRANRVRGLREAALSQLSLGPLPGELVKLILHLLPLDTRLRARKVSRGWCALLEDVRFWTRVDLSANCGVNPHFFDHPYHGGERLALALLRAACARAKGCLESVDLSGLDDFSGDTVVLQWLDSASAANKASLRDLVAPHIPILNVGKVTALCRALPLCRVRCSLHCNAVQALPMLRREPPFALLTIRYMGVRHGDEPDIEADSDDEGDDEADVLDDQSVLDMAAALAGYKGMEKLHNSTVLLATRAVLDVLVDGAISAGIKDAHFSDCGFSQTALPALTRLLQSPGFESLSVENDNAALFEGPALPAFCEALRNCTSLKALELVLVHLWDDMAVATQLIAALEGLPALQKLSLCGNSTEGSPAVQRAAGECLAHLIARSSSLRKLDVPYNRLGEAGVADLRCAERQHRPGRALS